MTEHLRAAERGGAQPMEGADGQKARAQVVGAVPEIAGDDGR